MKYGDILIHFFNFVASFMEPLSKSIFIAPFNDFFNFFDVRIWKLMIESLALQSLTSSIKGSLLHFLESL